ncbi:thermonuclease family protein [Pararhizobium sp. O133]|uniref:thermonuclease family protein n=1 Tax=Pararhizobium sp. O133 TaxID=3449278 RepID=UPI003F685192
MKKHLLTAGGGLLCIALTIFILMSGASTIQGRQTAATPDFTLETPDLNDVPDLGGDAMGTDVPLPGADGGQTDTGPGDGAPADVAPIDGGQIGGDKVEGGELLSDPTKSDPALSGSISLPSGESGMVAPQNRVVRDIGPEQFGLPEEVKVQPLERIEPRQPLSDPVAKPQPVPVVLRHPVALSAGLIRFGDRQLQLEGLAPQDAERTCGDGATTWPCGTVARTAFRNFLRARALRCTVPKNGWQGTVTAACTVSDLDPAAWLAENGWAEAQAGSPLTSKVDAARKSRLGFFGDDPRDFGATPEVLDGMDMANEPPLEMDEGKQGL